MVVPGADVDVPSKHVAFAPDDERHLGVHLQVGEAVDDVHARLLQGARPLDVAVLVEARLQLDEADALLAVLGAFDRAPARAGCRRSSGRRRSSSRSRPGRGRRPARTPRSSAANDSYGWWTRKSLRADLREQVARVLRVHEPRRRHPERRLGLQAPGGRGRSAGRGRRGRAGRGSRRPGRPRRRSPGCSRSSMPRDVELETSTRTTSPKRRRRSSSSTASSRSSASSETSKSASRVTRKTDRSTNLHPGEEPVEEVRDHASRAAAAARACRSAKKRGSPSGTFTRANRSSPVSGSRARTPRRSERPEMYGKG